MQSFAEDNVSAIDNFTCLLLTNLKNLELGFWRTMVVGVFGYDLFLTTFTASAFIIELSFMIHATNSLCCNNLNGKNKKNKASTIVRALCLLGLGFMCLCMSLCILIAITPMSPFSDYQNIINFIAFLVDNIGMGFVITFFLHSLYITSNATTYGYPACLLWSIGIFQWIFMIIQAVHRGYAFLVDITVFDYWFTYEIYILLQVAIHVLLFILFNRILYRVAKQSFVYSDARKLTDDKKFDRLLQVAVKYTILIWYTVFVCTCILCIMIILISQGSLHPLICSVWQSHFLDSLGYPLVSARKNLIF